MQSPWELSAFGYLEGLKVSSKSTKAEVDGNDEVLTVV